MLHPRLSRRGVVPSIGWFLDEATAHIYAAAARGTIAIVMGTERIVVDARKISALVVGPDGDVAASKARFS